MQYDLIWYSAVNIFAIWTVVLFRVTRGVQLTNPFYSIWASDVGTELAVSFLKNTVVVNNRERAIQHLAFNVQICCITVKVSKWLNHVFPFNRHSRCSCFCWNLGSIPLLLNVYLRGLVTLISRLIIWEIIQWAVCERCLGCVPASFCACQLVAMQDSYLKNMCENTFLPSIFPPPSSSPLFSLNFFQSSSWMCFPDARYDEYIQSITAVIRSL